MKIDNYEVWVPDHGAVKAFRDQYKNASGQADLKSNVRLQVYDSEHSCVTAVVVNPDELQKIAEEGAFILHERDTSLAKRAPNINLVYPAKLLSEDERKSLNAERMKCVQRSAARNLEITPV